MDKIMHYTNNWRVLTNDNGSTTFCKTTLIYLLPKLIDYSSVVSHSGIKLWEKEHFLVKLQMVKIRILLNTFWIFAEFEKKMLIFAILFRFFVALCMFFHSK